MFCIMTNCGIYCIKNLINNKVYIGKTNDLQSRWKNHLFVLRANTHSNKHLQTAFNKYGGSNFKFIVLLSFNYFNNDELNQLEIQYIQQYYVYYVPSTFCEELIAPKEAQLTGLHNCSPRQYKYYKYPPKDKLNRYHACNQSLLQQWLREIHNIHIYCHPLKWNDNEIILYNAAIRDFNNKGEYYSVENINHESALEMALKKGLGLIINK